MIEELNFSKYVMAKAAKCIQNHGNSMSCTCNNMAKAGKLVLEKKIVPLSYLWNKCFTGMTYDCEKAQKRLLQTPLTGLTVDGKIYIVEKHLQGLISDYEALIRDISSSHSSKQTDHTSKEEYDNLLHHVTQSEPEKEILKHVLCSSHNLSKRKASRLYGISLLRKRATKVNDAARIAKEINDRNVMLAKEQKKTILLSYGLDPEKILTSDSELNDGLSDSSDDDEVSLESSDAGESDSEANDSGQEVNEEQRNDLKFEKSNEHRTQPRSSDFEAVDVSDVVVLDMLKEASWNWFSFVVLLQEHFKIKGYSLAVFDKYLMDFAVQLPNLCLSDEEMRLTEHSRISYLETLLQKETDLGRNLDYPTDSSGDEQSDDEDSSKDESNTIENKLKQIDDKFLKKAKKEIAEQRFLRKKISWSTKTIIDSYPDIGDVIENIVQESDVGADSWCRTGVYTFTGDQ